MIQRTSMLVATSLAVLALHSAAWAETIRPLEPSSEPIHIRVLFESNPANEAVIAWTTTAEGESHQVYVDTEPRAGDLDAYAMNLESIHSGPYTLRDDEGEMVSYFHNVFLGDLEPATAYYLTVVSDGEASEEYHFITAPDDDRNIRVLFVGDSRVGGSRTAEDNNRRQVNALMARLLEAHPDIVAMVHGADYTNRAYWSQLYYWLNDHAEMTTTSDNRLLPIVPARGNHDRDVGFEEKFWWPDRENEFYYTTHLSANVALITLNSEISRGGDQRDWLESEMAALRSEKRWLLAQYHRPAWPSVRDFGSGSAQRDEWVPVFERYGLDLSYEAHDHALKRTVPIFEGEEDAERGVIYFGDGGGGVSQRQPDAERWYLAKVDRAHHAHLLHFTSDRIDAVAIDIDDEVRDEFTITWDKREAVR